MKKPFITVGLICRNEEEKVKDIIQSFLNLSYPNFEVIVVDGNSTDNTQKVLKSFKDKKFSWYSEKALNGKGRAFARNQIVTKGNKKAEYVAFSDADCVVAKDWLTKLVETIQKFDDNKIAGVGGTRLIKKERGFFSKQINGFMTSRLGSGNNPAFTDKTIKHTIHSIPNYNAMYKKSILLKYPYDNEFKGGEDLELNFRLSKLGFIFLNAPDAKIYHGQENSPFLFGKQMAHYGEMMIHAMKKHKKIIRLVSILPPLLVLGEFFLFLLSFIGGYWILFLGLNLLYAIFVVLGSLLTLHRSLLTIILLPIQHFCYGYGMIKGFFREKQ